MQGSSNVTLLFDKIFHTMKKFVNNIKEWVIENWDDIRVLLFIGIPSGIVCIVLYKCIVLSRLL